MKLNKRVNNNIKNFFKINKVKENENLKISICNYSKINNMSNSIKKIKVQKIDFLII